MTIQIEFDDKLGRMAGGATGTTVQSRTGLTVHSALVQVARAFPSLHLFNCEGEMRSILTVTRNGQPVAAVTDALEDGDTLRLAIG